MLRFVRCFKRLRRKKKQSTNSSTSTEGPNQGDSRSLTITTSSEDVYEDLARPPEFVEFLLYAGQIETEVGHCEARNKASGAGHSLPEDTDKQPRPPRLSRGSFEALKPHALEGTIRQNDLPPLLGADAISEPANTFVSPSHVAIDHNEIHQSSRHDKKHQSSAPFPETVSASTAVSPAVNQEDVGQPAEPVPQKPMTSRLSLCPHSIKGTSQLLRTVNELVEAFPDSVKRWRAREADDEEAALTNAALDLIDAYTEVLTLERGKTAGGDREEDQKWAGNRSLRYKWSN